jgi:hypothetical protein
MRFALGISAVVFIICVVVALFAALLEALGWQHNVNMEMLGTMTAASQFAVMMLFFYSQTAKNTIE